VRKVHVRKVAHPQYPKVVISEEIAPIAPTSPCDNIDYVPLSGWEPESTKNSVSNGKLRQVACSKSALPGYSGSLPGTWRTLI